MKTYEVMIHDSFFNQNFSGEFQAETLEAAKQDAQEFYAFELGTEPCEIEIVSAKEVA